MITNHPPEQSSSAELMYERMESQSGRCLPVLYEPLDHTKRSHWHDEALIGAFAHAMGDARSVLDVGPGDGWPALRIADRFESVVGIDPSPRRVRVQRENAERLGITNVEFEEMDVVDMGFPDASFGGVTAASSIEQSGDAESALREVFRVLEPGGRLAMVFEDYETCLGDLEGDEEMWGEVSDDEAVLFYKCRRKSPPRESWYALFLKPAAVAGDAALLERLANLRDSSPGGPAQQLLEQVSPLVTESKRFELGHMTSVSMNGLLRAVGFVDVRHTDHRIPELLAFFDAASCAGKIGADGPVFDAVAEVFGISAVERAGDGPGDFVLARKPG